ncbi:NFX1-type zinc finger-containing protein 1-like [Scleropages formosus]|uniref:NFX1-type zinc finger-containing protein 1-like n=1 Tax=Scleropages formosus TaxID=113540 RepID=A0A8C9V7W0_SCLFO|nr:NFX1-type zinc finger-containing protein 1-like [Scleropages formosus]
MREASGFSLYFKMSGNENQRKPCLGFNGARPKHQQPANNSPRTDLQREAGRKDSPAGLPKTWRTSGTRGRSPWKQGHGEPGGEALPQHNRVVQHSSGRTKYNHSQSRVTNILTPHVDSAGAQRPPVIRRPQRGVRNRKQYDHGHGRTQQSLSKWATSQPNLLNTENDLDGSGRKNTTLHNQRAQNTHKLDLKALKHIGNMEPSEIIMKLAAPGSGLKELLNRPVGETADSLTSVTFDVLSKACSSRVKRQNLRHLLVELKESQFLKSSVPMLIMDLSSNNNLEKMDETITKLNKVLDLYLTLVTMFPFTAVIDVSFAVALLETQFTQLNIPEETYSKLNNLQRTIAHLKEKKREGTLRSDNYNILVGDHDALNVENFRFMSIFPTFEDVHMTSRPYLRPNIVKEKFEDSNTYLETHFRLLREDFVRPLRDGISHLLTFDQSDLHKTQSHDIRVYANTRITSLVCTPKGILYKIQFNNKRLKGVNWESSKRLLYGALVCLSMDSFETLIFATVAHRDPKELSNGIVNVFFNEENRQKLANISKTKEFLMVETAAFFEAYRHVLEGLQELSAEDLPMQKYIIGCETDISPPKYLKMNCNSYSLQSLMNDRPLKMKFSGLEKNPLRHWRFRASQEADLRESVDQQSLKDILNLDDWPSKEELQLDASQMKAVQLALTKELAIIQGPPGTGKTHVGLKIVKALLDNAHVWGSALGSPILVVCYTNHALDQFLEGIYKFMGKASGLVRVGGRSCNDVIKNLSLSNLRKECNFTQKLPGHLRAMYCMLKDDMQKITDEIEKAAALLESSKKGILNDVILEDYIFSFHGRSLEDGMPNQGLTPDEVKTSVMLEWLGVSALNLQCVGGAAGKNGDDGAGAEEGLVREAACLMPAVSEEKEEGDVDVAGEAELEEAERMMDVDDVQKHIERAHNRLAMTQKQALLYVPEEENDMEERKKEVNEDGWQITSDMKKKLRQAVKRELQATECMLEEEALRVTDLWALSKKQRWSLYRLWLFKYQADINTMILTLENKYQEIINRMEELRNEEDETLLRKARVIGMTSTCAARYRKVLRAIQPQIVVVEEAAEVLEAHVVTTLTSGCQHLILIGDHQQLRPSTTVYDLAKNFNLDVSLFERLIGMNVPYVRLDYQHRMRPEIARLLSPHIYDKLENHDSVLEYENIKGVTTNVFFVEHEHLEESILEGHSHQNMHEATFVESLCYYLICQGYKPSQITVLTTYTGQLLCLKKIMSNSKSLLKFVKLCVVDRFQGEENDIIILSLVRSNREGKVGFLKIPNRICVALSRAKKGLFCIGNMSMLSSVPLWNGIIEELRCHGQIGEALSLRCENHPDTITTVSKAEHFAKVPHGGCSLPCEYRLDCGHVCARQCHPTDADHKLYKCMKACKTVCPDGHRCPKPCSAKCGECKVLVTKTIPKCGHEQQVPCSDPAEKFLCSAPCEKTLPCGHSCVRSCGETCTRRCPQRVVVDLVCGHQKVMLCSDKQEADKNPAKLHCWVKCGAELDCGHTCSGTCFQCKNGTAHVPCSAPCEVQLICLDYCKGKCGSSCVPCAEPCKNWCTHQMCRNPCSEPCQPCTKACEWRCQHHRCTLLCYEPCDRQPCHMPCLKRLQCQHRCIGMCGEPCPDKCRICNAEEVQEIFFGNEMDPEARFVQMADCGHIFEVTGFDQVMMLPEKNGVVKQKCCPKCKTVIHRSVRYGAFVKKRHLEMEMLKGKAAVLYSQHIESRVKEREQKGIRSPFIPPLLSKLAGPSIGLAEAMLIHKKIELLSQLAEIKHNTAALSGALQGLIGREADLCATKITEAEGYLWPKFEREIKRIWFLAETRAFSEKYLQSESIISTFSQEHNLLNEILSKLSESGNVLKEQDFWCMQTSVDSIAEKLDASIRWTMLDRTQYIDIDCGFLKLKHWSKCSKGHVYYTQPTENVNEMVQCLECSAE